MNLSIDTAALKQVAAKMGENGESFSRLLENINNVSGQLNGWTGSAAKSYTDALKEQTDSMKKLTTAIKNMSEYLNQVAVAYETVENNYTIK